MIVMFAQKFSGNFDTLTKTVDIFRRFGIIYLDNALSVDGAPFKESYL